MNKIIITVLVAITFSACNQNKNNSVTSNQDSYLLTGKLTHLGNDTIFLAHRSENGTVMDTTIAKNDSFSFSGKCPQSRIYTLQWFRNNGSGGKARVAKEIFMENAAISVTGDIDSPEEKIVVEGSAAQKKYDEFVASVKPLDDKMDSLEKLSASLGEQGKKNELAALDTAYDLLDEQKQNVAANFITQNSGSQVSAFIALRNFGTESAVVGTLDSIFQSLDTAVQNGYYGRQLNDLISSLKQTAIGMPAPGFTLNDTSGHPVSLDSYKGHVVLIDFWASWCGPCRRENPMVVEAYRKFHTKGLEILGVSLDEKRDRWIAAIAKDNLSWQHVSDLKGWSNSVAKIYAVRSIPNNYLLDKNGKIIAKSLYDDDLTKKLDEVLK